MRKKKIESCLLAAAIAAVITVPAFISGFMAGTAAEQHTQEEAARQQSTEMATLQIYNETQKTWDTYQGRNADRNDSAWIYVLYPED